MIQSQDLFSFPTSKVILEINKCATFQQADPFTWGSLGMFNVRPLKKICYNHVRSCEPLTLAWVPEIPDTTNGLMGLAKDDRETARGGMDFLGVQVWGGSPRQVSPRQVVYGNGY